MSEDEMMIQAIAMSLASSPDSVCFQNSLKFSPLFQISLISCMITPYFFFFNSEQKCLLIL